MNLISACSLPGRTTVVDDVNKISDVSQKCTVMVVDDSSSMREVMRHILKLGGYSVVAEAGNGVEAVRKFRQYRPKLTIMDVSMPEKNGIDATAEIIAINHSAKVVMCTSCDYDGFALEAENAGASGVIFKPFLYEEVHEILNSIVNGED